MDEEREGFGVMGPEDRFVIGRCCCGGGRVLRASVVMVVGRGELENGGRIAVSVVVEVEGVVVMWTREHALGC